MIELGALVLFGVAIVAVLMAVVVIIKMALWALLLPFRLLFWLLGTLLVLPALLLKLIGSGVTMLLSVPVAVIGVVLTGLAVAFAFLLPAIPVILMVGAIYYLLRPQPGPLARN